MTQPVRILIRLLGGFGLGDVVQHSIVLKHLAKYRPNWQVSVKAPRGAHSALVGLCHHVFHYEEPEQDPLDYDKVLDLHIFENYVRFPDRPSNKVAYCLRQTFNLDYDHDLARYEVAVSEDARRRACLPSSRAISRLRCRGEGGKNTKPTMSAPASSATSSVSRVDRPQILTIRDMLQNTGWSGGDGGGRPIRLWAAFYNVAPCLSRPPDP